jgi:hypothetical protein
MPILVQFDPNPPQVQAKQTPIAEKSINLPFNGVEWDRKLGTVTHFRQSAPEMGDCP